MNEAIKLAIEKGGLNLREALNIPDSIKFGLPKNENEMLAKVQWAEIILSPLFWQALGKALGWETITSGESENFTFNGGQDWLYFALLYMELRMTGGDEEKFWSDLLKGE